MIIISKKTQSYESLVKLEQIEPKSWIDLINPTNEEIEMVAEKTKVMKDYLKAALDEDERPRFDTENDEILIILRVPYEIENASPSKVKTMPIGIIIKGDYIITTRLFDTNVINDFHESKIKSFFTSKKTRFLIQILSRTNYYFLKNLDKIENEIDKIEKKLVRSLKNQEVFLLFELQKMLIYFNSAIIANGHVFEHISKGKVIELYKEDDELLDDIIVENRQCLDMASNYSNILSSTLDAYTSVISNNLNDVMKFLTALTIILSIPTIIASIYGMNVNLPFQTNPYAFWIAIILSLFFSALMFSFFARKNWL